MESTPASCARFGPFELDLRAGELRTDGRSCLLPDQVFQVLLILIEHDGGIATREEIKKRLWPNDTVVEFDHSINAAIKKLRAALDDSAGSPRYIETIPRRGYRLMMRVEQAPSAVSNSEDESSNAIGVTAPRPAQRVGRLTGETVSHYRVLEVIGGGGMGLVYRAEDLKLDRAVALKFLPEEVCDDPKARERFQREAHAVSALDHPNICTLYEFDEYQGHPFIAMQLLQGETLREHIALGRFRLSEPEGLEIATQIASGLAAAHERGIIHRDIKPANIFITEKNVAKILDFGVAKVIEAGESMETTPSLDSRSPASNFVDAPHLTRTGLKLGTAGYMSPEQVRGEQLDSRTDIFSFGLVLYEMATGRRPFSGATEADVQHAIEYADPKPVSELVAEVSPKLEAIVAKCLEKECGRRYQSAAEIRRELESVAVEMAPTKYGGKPWKWFAVACLVILAGLAWVGGSRLRHRAEPPSHPPLSIEKLTSDGNISGGATISSDGKYIAYAVADNGKSSIWIRQIVAGTKLQITPPMDSENEGITFSPDEAYVYYVQSGTLFRVPTLGGPAHKLIDGVRGPVSFSPDGKQMAYKTMREGRIDLVITDADGANTHVLWSRDMKGGFDPEYGTSWSSDGKRIATSAMDGVILVSDLSGKVKQVTLDLEGGQIFRLQWLPDSSGLAFIGSSETPGQDRVFLVTYPGGALRPLTTGTGDYDGASLGITADGSAIFAVQVTRGTDLWLTGGDFRHSKRLTEHRTDYPWGMDMGGDRIVYMSYEQGKSTLWTMKQDASNRVQTTPSGIRALFPALSPDGLQLLFQGMVGDKSNIWLGNVDGSDLRQITLGTDDEWPNFTSDGKSILFMNFENSQPHIMVIPVAGGTPRRLSDRTLDARSRACGNWVIAQAQDVSWFTYALVSTIDGHIEKIFEVPRNAYNIECIPGAQSVSYTFDTRSVQGSNIWEMPLNGRPLRQITHFDSDTVWSYVWSRDGRELLVSRGPSFSDAMLIRNFKP
jgi:serine/threonine protein kinase